MYKYRRFKPKEEDKVYPPSNEEKTNTDNNQTISTEISNKDNSYSTKRYKYKRFINSNKSEEEIETESNNNVNNTNNNEKENENNNTRNDVDNNNNPNDKNYNDAKMYELNNDNIENNNNIIDSSNINNNIINEDDEDINENTSIKLNSKKDLILKKFEDLEPIIEDKEGEENITPNKKNSINDDINHTKLMNNVLNNDFQNENDENKSPNIQKNKPVKTHFEKSNKYYDNELIDTILNVEKYNVNKYLSKDLAEMYSEINKDNLFFKNDVFLRNIDNFEKKTGILDKKKSKLSRIFIDDINHKLKDMSKTKDIINKYTEKSKKLK